MTVTNLKIGENISLNRERVKVNVIFKFNILKFVQIILCSYQLFMELLIPLPC